jgi:hypothetical protein
LGAACLGGVAAVLATNSSAADKADTISPDKLPAQVLAAARKESPAAVWKAAQKIVEEGETWYEISGVLVGNKKRLITVEVAPDGDVLLVTEMLARKKVPTKVMDAFSKKYKWTKETHAFEIREDGKAINYEFVTTRPRAGKKDKPGKKTRDEEITVIVSPDGGSVEVEGED